MRFSDNGWCEVGAFVSNYGFHTHIIFKSFNFGHLSDVIGNVISHVNKM